MEPDYTSTRLAEELYLPHEVVVKKVRKYAGYNQKQKGGSGAGRIYMEGNRLNTIKYGRGADGVTIYGFNKEQYDNMQAQELAYNEKQRKAAKRKGKQNYKGSGLEKYQKAQSK
tara:strand:- start:119 stop:460 length:342 start_codon:yes stop_codon:yes gene_type:complete